jgi:IS30 family transposase
VIIADRRRAVSMREIARELGRNVSTVSWELARTVDESRRYRPSAAHRMATARLARPRVRKVAADPILAGVVRAGWTLSGARSRSVTASRRCSPGIRPGSWRPRPSTRPSTRNILSCNETRATVCAPDGAGGGHTDGPTGAVPTRSAAQARSARSSTDPRRPHRKAAGHWEGDLITGRANRSAIATVVERASGFTLLLHLPGVHTAEVTNDALTAAFNALPEALRRSLTWDRGTERTDHAQLTAATGLDVFFADPHAPWQRGSNENTNGLIRQYFPKAPTWPCTPSSGSQRYRPRSTPDPESGTSGEPPPSDWPRYCHPTSRPSLRRSLKFKQSSWPVSFSASVRGARVAHDLGSRPRPAGDPAARDGAGARRGGSRMTRARAASPTTTAKAGGA